MRANRMWPDNDMAGDNYAMATAFFFIRDNDEIYYTRKTNL